MLTSAFNSNPYAVAKLGLQVFIGPGVQQLQQQGLQRLPCHVPVQRRPLHRLRPA